MTSESIPTFSRPNLTPEENAAIEAAWAEYEHEMTLARKRRAFVAANIPERFKEAAIADEFGKPYPGIAKALYDWVISPSDGVVLTGPIGVGKTWLACAAMMEYMEKWTCSGRFVNAAKYANEVIAYGTDRYYSPKILVLDDLGKEKPSEFVTQELFALIDTRGATNRKTIITTNYSMRELLERLTTGEDVTTAQAFASRLKRYKAIRVEGADRR